ncbi:MAG: hypothetical protein ACOX5R_02645 [bacterium]|jgi:hypothetical protein
MKKSAAIINLGLERNADAVLSQLTTALLSSQILEKAKSEGIAMKDMSVVKDRGKSRLVTANEKERLAQQQRAQVVSHLKMRSIRGESSLAADLNQRIQRCRTLIETLGKIATINDRDYLLISRALVSIQNRASSLVRDVEILEEAIERKKSEDPVIKAVELASSELLKAIRSKDLERVKELRKFCEEHISIYNFRKRRIKPYLAKAREARVKFINEKRRLMCVQFEISFQLAELCAAEMASGSFSTLDLEDFRELTAAVRKIRKVRSSVKPYLKTFKTPFSSVSLSILPDLETEFDTIDKKILQPLNFFVDRIERIISKIPSLNSEEAIVETPQANRMLFQQKTETP